MAASIVNNALYFLYNNVFDLGALGFLAGFVCDKISKEEIHNYDSLSLKTNKSFYLKTAIKMIAFIGDITLSILFFPIALYIELSVLGARAVGWIMYNRVIKPRLEEDHEDFKIMKTSEWAAAMRKRQPLQSLPTEAQAKAEEKAIQERGDGIAQIVAKIDPSAIPLMQYTLKQLQAVRIQIIAFRDAHLEKLRGDLNQDPEIYSEGFIELEEGTLNREIKMYEDQIQYSFQILD